MALPGYCIGDLVEDAEFLEANERAMQAIAAAARGITAVVGFVDCRRRPRRTTPARAGSTTPPRSSATAGSSSARASRCCPNYRYFDDKRFFTPGDRRDPVDVAAGRGSLRLGVSICEDMWDDFYDVKPLRRAGGEGRERPAEPQRVAVLSGQAARSAIALIRAHIRRLGKPIVYVNTVGAADNGKNIIPFDGESLVYDARRPPDRDRPPVRRGSADRRPRSGDAARRRSQLPPIDREREMYDALVMALRDYMRKTGFTRAIVAVSGGIDSALALAIAVDALGAGPRRPPSTCRRSTTPRRPGRSPSALAAAFGVRYGVIPIQDIDEHVRAVFEAHAHPIARTSRARTCTPASAGC